MKLLAIDPASSKCGIARFFEGKFTWSTTLHSGCDLPLARRLDIASQLLPFIVISDIVYAEEPFLLGKANTGMQRLLGMLERLTTGSVQFLHPMSVKKHFSPFSTSKLDLALAIGERLETEEEREMLADLIAEEKWDETDAVAIGLIGVERTRNATQERKIQ